MMLLAGGEPFVRPELLDITSEFPDIVFPVFTNGLLMKDEAIKKLKSKECDSVLSLEGGERRPIKEEAKEYTKNLPIAWTSLRLMVYSLGHP